LRALAGVVVVAVAVVLLIVLKGKEQIIELTVNP